MNEVEILIKLIENKEKLAAMIAPSFPIMYSYPGIITRLKKLGFSYTVEVSAGAKKTNEQLLSLMEKNPQVRYITSPCPTVVRMIRTQYPQYAKYFPQNVDSPMVATAKIVQENFQGARPVFIGPCIVKKLEAIEDYPELNILVLTYNELNQVFEHFNISDDTNPNDKFDISEPGLTRLYPLDGGLSHSSGITERFQNGELKVVSNWKNCLEAVKDFDTNTKIRLLDILFCDGGCIGGPGIVSQLSKEERIAKVKEYSQKIT